VVHSARLAPSARPLSSENGPAIQHILLQVYALRLRLSNVSESLRVLDDRVGLTGTLCYGPDSRSWSEVGEPGEIRGLGGRD